MDVQSVSSSRSGSVSSKSLGKESSSANTTESPRSSTNGGGSVTGGDRGDLSRKETENVNRLRLLTLGILILVAVGVSLLVYFITERTDKEEMEAQFQSASARLSDAFDSIRTDRIATLASLAIAAIAHGVDHSRDWPFVSLSFYQQRAFTAKLNSGALQVSIAPYVDDIDRPGWQQYVVSDEAEVDWIEQAIAYQEDSGVVDFVKSYGTSWRGDTSHSIQNWTGTSINDQSVSINTLEGQYIPFWEMSPFLSYDEVNVDMLQDERGVYGLTCLEEGAIVVGSMTYQPAGGIDHPNRITSTYAQLHSIDIGSKVEYQGDPMSYMFVPIFDSFEPDRKAKALLMGLFNWGILFRGVLPKAVTGIDLVLQNTCGEVYSYRLVKGAEVIPLGRGDLHDSTFDEYEVVTDSLQNGNTADGTPNGLPFSTTGCEYTMSIYPSQEFVEEYNSAIPAIVVSVVAFVFLFTIMLFLFYDRLVERRQKLVLNRAVQSSAIVSSLFPQNVRDRLLQSAAVGGRNESGGTLNAFRDKTIGGGKDGSGNTSSLTGDDNHRGPIADLFPNCSVLFADIAGFTAWSSTRSPEQVFTLLQTIYQAFDKIATRRRVFKVETIGDSYVAVTGLPEPQADHAVIMAKFARDCLVKMMEVTQALEVRLGPDTMELSMRFGINSGQVTGGVLLGDRARFQLFGDTVNTAARMESTGKRGRIQLSQSTADLIVGAGKSNWIVPREEAVSAKGKGVLQTYWLEMDQQTGGDDMDRSTSMEDQLQQGSYHDLKLGVNGKGTETKKQHKLVDWMSAVLLDYVKQIVAKNKVFSVSNKGKVDFSAKEGSICLDEIVESFDLLRFNEKQKLEIRGEYSKTELSPAVVNELNLYVKKIADLYMSTNPFHCFDHACHVSMSVHKLMKRVVSDGTQSKEGEQEHLETFGILTSDPLTLFAIVFSALIHDVDHRGVSNVQLAKEDPELAMHYRNKSVAEQNSFDISWNLLMEDSFFHLRQAIFPNKTDLLRFRQVAINIVLATDIFDKEMNDMRTERWAKVFDQQFDQSGKSELLMNTRATIVLEHIMQASDVSHTMQHWHVYLKWNRRLFKEMRLAYKEGRMGADPANFWYQGEMKFFDNYILPLADKIGRCGVFGVSSDEYLNYAKSNRAEWEMKGEAVVQEMIEETGGPNLTPNQS